MSTIEEPQPGQTPPGRHEQARTRLRQLVGSGAAIACALSPVQRATGIARGAVGSLGASATGWILRWIQQR
ncbi:hypothetical protein [Streptomyces sp. NPDC046759]|uniref:hypothetical protein n=1 Tax=Streptomyces sp. NPDC046759 TaxID=3155019 RepID=UPI0033D37EFA